MNEDEQRIRGKLSRIAGKLEFEGFFNKPPKPKIPPLFPWWFWLIAIICIIVIIYHAAN